MNQRPILSALVLFLLPSAHPTDALADSLSSAEAVRAEFRALCTAITDSEEIYHGAGRMRVLESRLRDSTGEDLEVVALRGALGQEMMKFGRWTEAIKVLSKGLEIADRIHLETQKRAPLLWTLALAHLQAAESANCVRNNNAASCVVPLRAGAIHRQPEWGRQAGDLFLTLLERDPRNLHAAWLANLARMLTDDYPRGIPERYRLGEAFAPETSFPVWFDIAPALGINSFDLAGGAIMDDFDGDGLLDLVTSTSDPCGSLKAFRNDGRGGFVDTTVSWGLDSQLGGLNLVHADYDGDGRLDLLVLRGAWLEEDGRIRNSLLRNELGRTGGGFTDMTRAAGLAEPPLPTISAAWGDYDRDGDLDLYVANEGLKHGSLPSQLFRNNGDGTFTDVAEAAGVSNRRVAKAAAWGDYDNDGDLDLYVSNIGANRLYRNEGDGSFTDVAPSLGVTGPTSRSFATWFFDYDNDGDLDLFVASYTASTALVAAGYFGFPSTQSAPVLYRNNGGEGFTDVSVEVGFTRSLTPMGANYGDLDNDGWLDIYLGTGDPGFGSLVPNVMFRNLGGLLFSEVTMAGGFGHLQKGHGVAFGDLDNDGDQDLFHQLGGFYPGDAYGNALFENPGPAGHWITLRLQGKRSDSFALGARIEARITEGKRRRSVHGVVGSGGSFGGGSFQHELGIGKAELIDELIIRWPGSGLEQTFQQVAVDRVYEVIEGQDDLVEIELPSFRLGSGKHGGHGK